MHAVLAAEGAFPNRLIGIVAPVQTRSRDGKDPKRTPLLEGLRHSDRRHNNKGRRCNCYTRIFLGFVAVNVRRPAPNRILHHR